jgi:CubicO group peptidase (beta-lactamase class C family)
VVSRRLWLCSLAVGALLLGIATPRAALAFLPAARAEKVDAAIKDLIDNRSTPGVAVLILQAGKPVYSRSAGVREPGGSAPIAEGDMFRLASMTKAVTSVATMILVEEGKLGLDDPLSRHLPGFASLRVRGPDGAETPAFINRPQIAEAYRDAKVTDGLDQPEVTTPDAMKRLASAPLAFQPGTSWEYSLATDVLGAVVEKVTGGTLGSFVTERVAKPLRIESWVFSAPDSSRARFVPVNRPAEVTGALRTGYVPVTATESMPFPATKGTITLDPNRVFSPTAYHSGGGGMSGTLADYGRFAQMLLNEGELDGARVLKAETVRQMIQNATGEMLTLRGPGWGFSLGFGVVTDSAAAKTRLPAGSYGWGGVYGTQFWVDPTNKVAGIVMTQTAIIGSGPIANAVREAFYAPD